MQVDFNLLVALDALLEENSVQGAADRLRLSPPAMSRTLARIRRATGDEILVRTGRTMTPTPRATALQAEARELVLRVAAVLTSTGELDLATLERTFTIRGHDALVNALTVPLTREVATAGPGLGLTLLAEPAGDTTDLARGRVDLEVGATLPTLPEFASALVGTDRMVAVFRADHPLADGDLTPEQLAETLHVAVSRRGRRRGPIDEALARQGLRRRVLTVVPTTAVALHLVAHTDAVAVVTERSCAPTIAALGLRSHRLPLDVPPVPVVLVWHHRMDRDPAHAWLRTRTQEILKGVLLDPDRQAAHDS